MAKQDSTQCLALKFRELPAAEVGAGWWGMAGSAFHGGPETPFPLIRVFMCQVIKAWDEGVAQMSK
eukprot:CAMPEP_0117684492 /NCGR_PEP_ID=MMETSP0804-20121206/21124_1 /TAXON_ID=1074897 /ORGANISM="Tetraselmis astigmatica, Strain CCMP880" /LENGTH=65 /DNA_ID=CAMNT_0005495479 /DNA_START=242 /DNA_END=437 /DNA_ORIENTATION=-